MLPSLSVIMRTGHCVHATPALDEYMLRGQGSHSLLLLSRVPLAHAQDINPMEPPGDVEPVGDVRGRIA